MISIDNVDPCADPYVRIAEWVLRNSVNELRILSRRDKAIEWIRCYAAFWLDGAGIREREFMRLIALELAIPPVDYPRRKKPPAG